MWRRLARSNSEESVNCELLICKVNEMNGFIGNFELHFYKIFSIFILCAQEFHYYKSFEGRFQSLWNLVCIPQFKYHSVVIGMHLKHYKSHWWESQNPNYWLPSKRRDCNDAGLRRHSVKTGELLCDCVHSTTTNGFLVLDAGHFVRNKLQMAS